MAFRSTWNALEMSIRYMLSRFKPANQPTMACVKKLSCMANQFVSVGHMVVNSSNSNAPCGLIFQHIMKAQS